MTVIETCSMKVVQYGRKRDVETCCMKRIGAFSEKGRPGRLEEVLEEQRMNDVETHCMPGSD